MVHDTLLERCIRQEAKAQYELYRVLYPMMMSICSRYERNRQDAAATMNQGFLKILQHLGRRPDHVPFEPWARRVVINTVIDQFRRNKERKAVERLSDDLSDHDTSEVNSYLREMEAEELARLLEQLPPVSRHVFNLFAIDGFAHAEIAEMLGISEGTSKWHVSHARTVLQKAIGAMAAQRTLNTPHR
ncbi:MAG: sigma-70 family RNA polymerase sigma factor [Flavobacteriales bacterium]|nr:sigma-70 family RNA polymerase sigma factor [Flavobacteriales bacterium]